MKKIVLLLFQMPLMVLAQGFLQLHNTGKILYPENFLSVNGLVQVNSSGVLTYPSNFAIANHFLQLDENGYLKSPQNFFTTNGVVQVNSSGIISSPANFVSANGLVQVNSSGVLTYPDNFAIANHFLQLDENGYLKSPQNFFTANGVVQVNSSGIISSPTNFVSANNLVQVDSSGVLQNKTKFIEANNIVSNEVVCLRVDMLGTEERYTDAELKILDASGKLLYFATTNYKDQTNYHNSDGTWDSGCKIYYYIAGTKYAQGDQCSSPKQRHKVDSSNQRSIGSKESARITAIEFYPNLAGKINNKSIRSIVLDPDNTIIISRKNSNSNEKDNDENRIWRPIIPQYYKAYPTK